MATDGPDPEALLRQARAGEDEALGSLLQLYRPYLMLLARVQIGRRLRGKADASDVVQEAFLEAHKGIARFRGNTEAEWVAWLRQILARNLGRLIRRYLGTARRNVRLERQLAAELDQSSGWLAQAAADSHSSPSRLAVRREQSVLLADALDRLPDDYREVIILSHLEELSFPEVARRMGKSLDSVKNLWARALARLRRSMGGDQ